MSKIHLCEFSYKIQIVYNGYTTTIVIKANNDTNKINVTSDEESLNRVQCHQDRLYFILWYIYNKNLLAIKGMKLILRQWEVAI